MMCSLQGKMEIPPPDTDTDRHLAADLRSQTIDVVDDTASAAGSETVPTDGHLQQKAAHSSQEITLK
jgi:hypothetical protein